MLKPASALRKFLQTDCCDTGRMYPPVSVTEIKEFKEACTEGEYAELGQQAIDHLVDHETIQTATGGSHSL